MERAILSLNGREVEVSRDREGRLSVVVEGVTLPAETLYSEDERMTIHWQLDMCKPDSEVNRFYD